jgi:hypothetical protein
MSVMLELIVELLDTVARYVVGCCYGPALSIDLTKVLLTELEGEAKQGSILSI